MPISFDPITRLVIAETNESRPMDWRFKFSDDTEWQRYLSTDTGRLEYHVGQTSGLFEMQARAYLPSGAVTEWSAFNLVEVVPAPVLTNVTVDATGCPDISNIPIGVRIFWDWLNRRFRGSVGEEWTEAALNVFTGIA